MKIYVDPKLSPLETLEVVNTAQVYAWRDNAYVWKEDLSTIRNGYKLTVINKDLHYGPGDKSKRRT